MKLAVQFARAACLVLLGAALACGVAAAQGGHGGGGGAPGGRGGGGGMNGGGGMPGGSTRNGMGIPPGGMGRGDMRGGPPPNAGSGSTTSTNRGGLQLGPPGRWWDDKKFAKSLGLNDDQQKRMDSLFAQNRDALLSRYEGLQRAESKLEGLTRTAHPDESALFAEIDHVAQARAELEKANTHMLLQIRGEMTPDQIGKLEDHR